MVAAVAAEVADAVPPPAVGSVEVEVVAAGPRAEEDSAAEAALPVAEVGRRDSAGAGEAAAHRAGSVAAAAGVDGSRHTAAASLCCDNNKLIPDDGYCVG